ncbi:hypothetical protein ACTD5D_19305 [Nocardia takedensis]|uniref:hypothetical protein n=1 Tax=Nocardia takedensis TaxID=259390 RepID=UPI003F75D5F9
MLQTIGALSDHLLLGLNPFVSVGKNTLFGALPPQVQRGIRSVLPLDRLEAVDALRDILINAAVAADPELLDAARLALMDLTEDDSRSVMTAARKSIAPWSQNEYGERLLLDQPSENVQFNFYGKVVINMNDRPTYVGGDQWGSGDKSGGDINKVTAGRDIQGAAAGRANSVAAEGSAIGTAEEARQAFGQLAEDVGASSLDVREKSKALNALLWWGDHVVEAEVNQSEAAENTGRLREVGGWVWERFTGVLQAIATAGAAAWLADMVMQLQ